MGERALSTSGSRCVICPLPTKIGVFVSSTTGGTALAAVELLEKFEGKTLLGAGFIIDLPELGGAKRLAEKDVSIHSLMEF